MIDSEPRRSRYFRSSAGWFRLDLGVLPFLRLFLPGTAKLLPARPGLRQALSIVRKLRRGRRGRALQGEVADLPVDDPMALKVNGGFKTFDPVARSVTKVFADDVPQTDRDREIALVERSAACPAAPAWHGILTGQAGYREELIAGTPLVEIATSRPGFYASLVDEFADLLVQIASVDKLVARPAVTLVEKPLRIVKSGRDAANAFLSGCGDAMVALCEESAGRVGQRAPYLFQCFSHGDFSLLNISRSEEGALRILDWETAGQRALLNDLFNLLTVELYYERADAELPAVSRALVRAFADRLVSLEPSSSQSVQEEFDAYRWTFYVERCAVLVERRLTPRIAGVIKRSVDVFRRYEGLLQGS